MSTPECGTNQKPRKMTLPVMLATNTWPSTSTLTASTSPVANVNSKQRGDRQPFGDRRFDGHGLRSSAYSCGVRSNDVTVDIRVINHFASWRSIVNR